MEIREQNLTEKAARAAYWSAIETAFRSGSQLLVSLVLARMLSPADFGLAAMLLVFTSIASVLSNLGFSAALIQRENLTESDKTTVFLVTIGTSLVLASLMWLAAPPIAQFYSQPELLPLSKLFVFTIPLGVLAIVPDAMLTKQLNFRARAQAEVVASCLAGAVAVALALAGFGVWSLAWQNVLAVSFRTILFWRSSGWVPRGRFLASSFRNLFGFGGYMLLSGLLDTIYLRLQSLLIGKLYDSRTLGYFTLAQTTQQAPAALFGSIFNQVGLPVFSSVTQRPATLLRALRLSQRVAAFLSIPCMYGLALAAKPLVQVMYGPNWIDAAPILSILAIASSFWPMHVLNFAAISATGRSDLIFNLAMIHKLVGIALVIAFSAGGALAIAWGALIATVLAVLVTGYYVKRLLNYRVEAQFSDQAGTYVVSIAAASAGWVILHWTSPSIVTIAFAISAAFVVYFAIAAIFRHAALSEIIALARTAANKRR